MSTTGPQVGPQVVGEPAIDRLMRSLDYRLNPDVAPLTREQVAVVLHALADHTAIMAALRWRRDEDCPWPDALSVGRWMHDVADQAERSVRAWADCPDCRFVDNYRMLCQRKPERLLTVPCSKHRTEAAPSPT